jgi:hypothetical protein
MIGDDDHDDDNDDNDTDDDHDGTDERLTQFSCLNLLNDTYTISDTNFNVLQYITFIIIIHGVLYVKTIDKLNIAVHLVLDK